MVTHESQIFTSLLIIYIDIASPYYMNYKLSSKKLFQSAYIDKNVRNWHSYYNNILSKLENEIKYL
jgi:hypothetical protein